MDVRLKWSEVLELTLVSSAEVWAAVWLMNTGVLAVCGELREGEAVTLAACWTRVNPPCAGAVGRLCRREDCGSSTVVCTDCSGELRDIDGCVEVWEAPETSVEVSAGRVWEAPPDTMAEVEADVCGGGKRIEVGQASTSAGGVALADMGTSGKLLGLVVGADDWLAGEASLLLMSREGGGGVDTVNVAELVDSPRGSLPCPMLPDVVVTALRRAL